MFSKLKLKREINKLKKDIAYIEGKRNRSQAALIQAILQNTTPSDTDVDFFNTYTAQIDYKRAKMQELTKELEAIQ